MEPDTKLATRTLPALVTALPSLRWGSGAALLGILQEATKDGGFSPVMCWELFPGHPQNTHEWQFYKEDCINQSDLLVLDAQDHSACSFHRRVKDGLLRNTHCLYQCPLPGTQLEPACLQVSW